MLNRTYIYRCTSRVWKNRGGNLMQPEILNTPRHSGALKPDANSACGTGTHDYHTLRPWRLTNVNTEQAESFLYCPSLQSNRNSCLYTKVHYSTYLFVIPKSNFWSCNSSFSVTNNNNNINSILPIMEPKKAWGRIFETLTVIWTPLHYIDGILVHFPIQIS